MKLRVKAITRILLAFMSIFLVTLVITSCSIEDSRKEGYLLDTQWDQVNLYAKFCPDNNRAGCWSTAIAQILYFHKITPTGNIDYETTTGYKVSEDLDSYEFNWDLFVERLDEKTSEESIAQVAKYIYYTSIVLEKDYDTGAYMTIKNQYKNGMNTLIIDEAIDNLEKHFNSQAVGYHYTKKELEAYKDDIEKLIKKEIDANRPIMLYMQAGYNGHAAVIDGYSYFEDKFIVHINQGAGGYGNKWYDFNKPIVDEIDDMNHRMLITIKPSISNTKPVIKDLDKANYLLETQWDQQGNYSKYCPRNETIGHWSTALAQILAYHKYRPTGKINYESTSGLKIKEDLDSYEFNWELFVERLDAKASMQSIDQIAKYNYYTEIVLERDFDSMKYNTIYEDESNTDVSKAIDNLNKYFNCDAHAYSYTEEEIKASKNTIIELIKTELDNKRPLLLYYKPYGGEGSSVVIDGYSEENNEFFVHINTGVDGANNQWYKLFGSMAEIKHWIFITLK